MGCCSKKKKPAQGNTMNKSGDSSILARTNATQPRASGTPGVHGTTPATDARIQRTRDSHQKALKSKDSIEIEPKEVKQKEAKEDKQKKEEKKKDKNAEINESEQKTEPKFPEVKKLDKSKKKKDEAKTVPVPEYSEPEKNEKIEKQEPKNPESMESKKDKVREKKKKESTSPPNDLAYPLNLPSEAKSVPRSVRSASSVDNNDGAAKKGSNRSKYPIQKMTIISHVKDGMVISQWAYTEMREIGAEPSSIADLLAGGGRSQINLKA